MDDDGFQVTDRKKQGGSPASVRVYLGGLPVRESIQQELLSWLEQNLPQHITIGSIQIKQGVGKGKKHSPSSSFALIECGKHTNEVIRTLMGTSFEGHRLTVQREQRIGNNNHQKSDDNKKNPFHQRGGGGTGRGGRGRSSNFTTSFNKRGWSKPSESITTTRSNDDGIVPRDDLKEEERFDDLRPLTMEETSSKLAEMVSSEIEQAGDDGDNLINTALASTAAVAFLASTMAAGDLPVEDGGNNNTSYGSGSSEKQTIEPREPTSEESTFASFVKGQSLTALLADFGEEDPEWKKVEAPPSEGEEQQQIAGSCTGEKAPFEQKKFVSRLAPHGKAPIHICLESFGYVHGAPSRQSQECSWSPYSQPLAPIDCRSLFEPAPSYLDFHDGLHSGQVKRVLLQQSRCGHGGERNDENSTRGRDGRDSSKGRSDYKDIQDFAKRIMAGREIWAALLEAQNVGHHGYVSPLQMKILVGSHLGRHRSVLVVEWAAIELRDMLRKNKDNAIHQPVSVGTLHRDIEKRIPTRKYKEDDDDDRVQ